MTSMEYTRDFQIQLLVCMLRDQKFFDRAMDGTLFDLPWFVERGYNEQAAKNLASEIHRLREGS